MTADEAEQILGPDLAAKAHALGAARHPLTPAQLTVLAALFDINLDDDDTRVA